MKLQKHLAYKYKRKKYYKHIITIPTSTLEELGWKPGENLEQIVENGRLVIKPDREFASRVKEDLLTEKVRRLEVNESGNSK